MIILLLTAALSCDKDSDPAKYTSINGYWVVRTPDDLTTLTFRVEQDQDGRYTLPAQYVSVQHNGTSYDSKPVDAAIVVVGEREIESMTFINTSTQVPFFVIRFQQLSVNENFTQIQVLNASFNVDGAFREFNMITATRN